MRKHRAKPRTITPDEWRLLPDAAMAPGETWVYSAREMLEFREAGAAQERARWEAAIGPLMPADYKTWRDSPEERPETAAFSIQQSREQEKMAWECIALQRKRCADMLTVTRQEVQLAAGELSHQEWRAVQAVLKWIQRRMLAF